MSAAVTAPSLQLAVKTVLPRSNQTDQLIIKARLREAFLKLCQDQYPIKDRRILQLIVDYQAPFQEAIPAFVSRLPSDLLPRIAVFCSPTKVAILGAYNREDLPVARLQFADEPKLNDVCRALQTPTPHSEIEALTTLNHLGAITAAERLSLVPESFALIAMRNIERFFSNRGHFSRFHPPRTPKDNLAETAGKLESWIEQIKGTLARRRVVDVSFCQMTALPKQSAFFVGLVELNLTSNRLCVLPDILGTLTKLQRLFLAHNRLSALPATLRNLSELRVLDLSHNGFRQVPGPIAGMTSLRKLNMQDNQVETLPATLWSLTKLQFLLFTNNRIREIPNGIGRLSDLRNLALSHNLIASLPVEMSHLRLRLLQLDGNCLTVLFASFEKWVVTIGQFSIGGNGLTKAQLLPFQDRLNKFDFLQYQVVGGPLADVRTT